MRAEYSPDVILIDSTPGFNDDIMGGYFVFPIHCHRVVGCRHLLPQRFAHFGNATLHLNTCSARRYRNIRSQFHPSPPPGRLNKVFQRLQRETLEEVKDNAITEINKKMAETVRIPLTFSTVWKSVSLSRRDELELVGSSERIRRFCQFIFRRGILIMTVYSLQ